MHVILSPKPLAYTVNIKVLGWTYIGVSLQELSVKFVTILDTIFSLSGINNM